MNDLITDIFKDLITRFNFDTLIALVFLPPVIYMTVSIIKQLLQILQKPTAPKAAPPELPGRRKTNQRKNRRGKRRRKNRT